jgi:hypothetical protein
MHRWMQLFTAFVILASWTGETSKVSGAAAESRESREESDATVVLRFSKQQIVSCSEPKERIARRKLICRADQQWTSGIATLTFEPLVDPRRRVLRTDRRSRFSVELHQTSQPTEQGIAIAKGPWRITWKEAKRSIRVDVEDVAVRVVLTTTIGKCRSGNWRCWLDTRAREHRLDVRSGTGR